MSLAPQAKRMLRLALWVIIPMALALSVGIWWLTHDEPLMPEVAAALRFEPPAPETMRDNGYFTLLGLGAPPDEDALVAGQRFFAAQLQSYESYRRTGKSEPFADSHHRIDQRPSSCNAEVDDCYAYYVAHAEELKANLAEHATLTTHYLSLQDKPVYEEIVPPYFAIALANYPDAVDASALIDMRAALLLNEGHVDEALALLETNAQIHHKMMQGSRTMIGFMISLAMDVRQQRLISSALRHVPALSADHAQRLDALVSSLASVPITAALEYEMQTQLLLYDTLPKMASIADEEDYLVNGPWFNLLYLTNATLNTAYRQWQEPLRLSRLPPDQLAKEVAVRRKTGDATESSGLPLPSRNYVGNVLLSMASIDFMIYIERAHDVEGYRRLIRLQIAALHERVPPEKMPEWLATQPPELRDPYTLQPMKWDAATQSLVFEGKQNQTQNPEPKNVYRAWLGKP
ncbi:MAG: hypothetical protein LBE24_01720 [Methylobacillus sp.]|jgi:hypothetical protein|nr:hypothetical protein [Methylobacillus sp.]